MTTARDGVEGGVATLERRKGLLSARPALAPVTLLHPNMADVYPSKVLGLRDALAKPESRSQAADLLRGFVDEIQLTPADGILTIAVKGNLAGVMAAAGLPTAANGVGCGGGI